MIRILKRPRWGFLFSPHALWVGAHYSTHARRWCVNVVPWFTVYVVEEGGWHP